MYLQSMVLGHVLAAGLVSGSQLDVVQVTAPGVPFCTPHFFFEQPIGAADIHLPKEWEVSKVTWSKG